MCTVGVSHNGLGFNPLKSVCVTYGKSKLGTSNWNIKGEHIVQLKDVKYRITIPLIH